jgi:hypothetical protein
MYDPTFWVAEGQRQQVSTKSETHADTRGMLKDTPYMQHACSFARCSRASLIATMLVAVLVLVIDTSCAQAHFEWLEVSSGVFAGKGLEGEMGHEAGGVAVDDTTGVVYIADGIHNRVTAFDSHGKFAEAWGWGVTDEVTEAFQHCGPTVKNNEICAARGVSGEGAGEFREVGGITVDQATGDVYVLNMARQDGVVQVFSASGEYISSFGERGGQGQPISEKPELIRTPSKSGIAVDDATGDAFVVDHDNDIPEEGRVMVFKPTSPGDYSHYEYEGLQHDFANHENYPTRVATGFVGDVYVSSESVVYEYGPASRDTPLWEHEDNKVLQGMTVDPGGSGDVFYYTATDRKFHELSSVEELATGGKAGGIVWPGVSIFEEFNGKFETVLEEQTEGLAFNPGLVWSVGRPAGVLYAADPHLVAGLIFAEPVQLPPSVGSVGVSGVGSGSALFEASIDPHGFDTEYSFQYGTEDCFEHVCSEVPLPSVGDVGSGGEARTVTAQVTGLLSDTVYYYRVVASSHCKVAEPSVVCTVYGPTVSPSNTFMTFPEGGVVPPDGRAYELVSPPDKDGGEVFPLSPSAVNCEDCMPGANKERFPMQSTANGDAVVYEGDPFAAEGDAVSENEYLSIRGLGGGWGVPDDLSPVLEGKAIPQGYKMFSSDLSRGVLYEIEQSFAGAPSGYPDLYLKNTVDGTLQPLITEAPANRVPGEFKLTFAGASLDFNHLVFEANGALATGAGLTAPSGTAAENDLYEWVEGSLRLVNVLPGETAEPGAEVGSGEPIFSHAVSDDGSRIFWTDENHAHGHFGQIYVRENGEKTLEIPDSKGGMFSTASADGSKVLLSDGRVYDVGDAAVTEEPSAITEEGHKDFQGILGASETLSHVYFVDTAVLTGSEENSESAKAEAGKDNLYILLNGSVKFVGVLSGGDDSTDLYHEELGNTGDWTASPSQRTAQVTPDGEYLAFMSQANIVKGADVAGFFEVYEYDANTGSLVCTSCNPTGERPIGPSILSVFQPHSGFLPQPSSLLMDGRVFFDSYDELSPLDTNGDFEDVYEYQPNGFGSCVLPAGCISLISSGREEVNSSFVNATPSGSDVFFTTSSRLVPQDQDDLVDLYDARIGGVPAGPLPSPPCEGDLCKGPYSSPPLLETLPSTIVTGMGNFTPASPVLSSVSSKPKSSPTRAQLLAKALSACRRARAGRAKRLACEKRARKLYGSTTRTKKTSATRSSRRKVRSSQR